MCALSVLTRAQTGGVLASATNILSEQVAVCACVRENGGQVLKDAISQRHAVFVDSTGGPIKNMICMFIVGGPIKKPCEGERESDRESQRERESERDPEDRHSFIYCMSIYLPPSPPRPSLTELPVFPNVEKGVGKVVCDVQRTVILRWNYFS